MIERHKNKTHHCKTNKFITYCVQYLKFKLNTLHANSETYVLADYADQVTGKVL